MGYDTHHHGRIVNVQQQIRPNRCHSEICFSFANIIISAASRLAAGASNIHFEPIASIPNFCASNSISFGIQIGNKILVGYNWLPFISIVASKHTNLAPLLSEQRFPSTLFDQEALAKGKIKFNQLEIFAQRTRNKFQFDFGMNI